MFRCKKKKKKSARRCTVSRSVFRMQMVVVHQESSVPCFTSWIVSGQVGNVSAAQVLEFFSDTFSTFQFQLFIYKFNTRGNLVPLAPWFFFLISSFFCFFFFVFLFSPFRKPRNRELPRREIIQLDSAVTIALKIRRSIHIEYGILPSRGRGVRGCGGVKW